MAGREGIEGIRTRLNNIRSVEPILGAMRTISLGSWQAALNRKGRVGRYTEQLAALLSIVGPQTGSPGGRESTGKAVGPPMPTLLLVIGSERGLCGAFNSTLIRYVGRLLAEYEKQDTSVEVAALGSRARRALERLGRPVAWSRSLPMTALPTSDLAYELTQAWLGRYEERELDAVDVVYNAYRRAGIYEPVSFHLLPPTLSSAAAQPQPWPPPYIDTDPLALYTRLAILWMTTELYRILLDSAAAEHSARFQLMEGATQNSARLINDLTLALQSARQQAITSEMQELATGAGLLGGQEE